MVGDDDCLLMKAGEDKILQRKEIKTPDRTFLLLLTERDLGVQYPGMIMYSLRILSGDTEIARFATNTYEYPPSSPSIVAEAALDQGACAGRGTLRADVASRSAYAPAHGV